MAPNLSQSERPLGARRFVVDPIAFVLCAVPLGVSSIAMVGNFDSAAAIKFVALVAALSSVFGLLRVRRLLGVSYDIGAALFWFGILFWFFGPGLMTALSSRQFNQSAAAIRIYNADALTAYFAVSVFIFVFISTYYLVRVRGLTVVVRRDVGAGPIRDRRRTLTIIIVVAVISLTFYAVAAGGIIDAARFIAGSRTIRKPWDSEGNYGTSLTPFHILFTSFLISVACTTLHLVLSRKLRGTMLLVAIGTMLLTMLSVAIESGTRSSLILCLGPPLVVFYRAQRGRNPLSRVGGAILIGVLVLAALITANFQREYRTTGELGETAVGVQDSDFLTETAFAVAIHRAERKLTYDSPFLHIITGPIPRVLWKGKPESESMVVYSRYIRGHDIKQRGGNSLPSIVGQYLLSWGWFGVLEIGFWLGLMIGAGDRVFRRLSPDSLGRLGYAIFATYVFIAFRTIGFFFFTPVVSCVLFGHILAAGRRRLTRTSAGAPAPRSGVGQKRQ